MEQIIASVYNHTNMRWLLILLWLPAMGQGVRGVITTQRKLITLPPVTVDSAKFNFNLNQATVTGWNMVTNHPHLGVRTATDATTGITVSSVAISPTWTAYQSNSANNTNGAITTTNTMFPAEVIRSYFFNYDYTVTVDAAPSIRFSNLNPAKKYKIFLIGSRDASGITGSSRLADYIVKDNVGTTTITNYNAKGNVSSTITTSADNATIRGGIAAFYNLTPTSGGTIDMRVNPGVQVDGDLRIAYLNGLIIMEDVTSTAFMQMYNQLELIAKTILHYAYLDSHTSLAYWFKRI